MDTRDLAILVQAAAVGSLSAAARRLEITPMVASRRLAALEQQLGVRLMHRTTRAVSLTAEGEAFLPYAQAMIEAEQGARAALAPTAHGASGLLRITAPAAFGRKVVAPLMPDILAANPELRIDLQLTDAVVDIVGAGIDVAVRIGRLQDSTLIARRLAPNPRRLCASSAYVARAGQPKRLADLAAHNCLTLTSQTHWPFESSGRRREVRVSGPVTSDSIEAVHVACGAGLGLALLSAWDVEDDLAAGRLVTLDLADAEPQELAIWAVYPTARLIPQKVHAFVEALGQRLRAPPARS